MSRSWERIPFIDSHTGAEPTRVIHGGLPDLGSGSVAERLVRLKQHDWLRQCVINEPRGWNALVGAVLLPPADPESAAGVIFINNAGYLGMCGHGAIGVAVTLHYLERVPLGRFQLETPVGNVIVDLLDPHTASIENVPSYRLAKGVRVPVEGLGDDVREVTGDIAWGGNWFFLVDKSPVPLRFENVPRLGAAAQRVSEALERHGITGADGARIDHIEFFGPAESAGAHSRNFVLCPGGEFDRSPCGTGTSAKVACLAADGKLAPGRTWVQESITGSRFEAVYRDAGAGRVTPRITGSAYVVKEGVILRDPADPLLDGLPPLGCG